jgi:tetratricopeptide (TPR) repeat protein
MSLRSSSACLILPLCCLLLVTVFSADDAGAVSFPFQDREAAGKGAAPEPEDPEKLLADGLRALSEGRYSKGLPLLTRGHGMRPDDGRFTFALGRCFFASGEEFVANPDYGGDPGAAFYDAENYFRKTLSLDPSHSEAGAMLAHALFMNGDLDGAKETIEEHLSRCPDDTAARILAGKILVADFVANGESAGSSLVSAGRHLSLAIESDPGAAGAYVLLGDCHLHGGDGESALTAYQAGIAACPGEMAIHQRLVTCFQGSDLLPVDDAIGFYRAILVRKGAKPEERGSLYWFLGVWHDAAARTAFGDKDFAAAAVEYGKSARCYESCRREHSLFDADARLQEAQAWANVGWAYYYAKDYNRAEAKFGRALALAGDLQNAILGLDYLGTAILSSQGMEKGRDFFRRAALTNPRQAKWWNNYGLFCRETGEHENSYRAYVKAAALSPGDTRYINDAGMMLMYYLKRDSAEAESLFRRAWKIGEERCDNPFLSETDRKYHFEAYCDAMLNLGRLLLIDGRTAEAETVIRSLGEKAPERADVRQLLGALELAKEGKPFEIPE